MSQRTYRGHGYAALARELEAWRQLPTDKLVARVGAPPTTSIVDVGGEEFTLDIVATWSNEKCNSVRVAGVASGSSHLQIERIEEKFVVSIHPKSAT
jgi:hypothetical protein